MRLCELWVTIRKENLVSVLSDKNVVGRRLRMNKKNNVTDKNIKIKTTGGTTVNIAYSYAEDKTLETLFLSYLEREVVEKVPA